MSPSSSPLEGPSKVREGEAAVPWIKFDHDLQQAVVLVLAPQ